MNKTLACLGSAIAALATTAMTSLVADAAAVPSFNPLSVTFVSTSDGWALGNSPCSSGRCLSLRKTTDGGRKWTAEPFPSSVLSTADVHVPGGPAAGSMLNVRFANAKDGWVFGDVQSKGSGMQEAALWSTTDGGATWRPVSVPGLVANEGSILDVEAGGGKAYLVFQSQNTVRLESSTPGDNNWSVVPDLNLGLPAGGAELTAAIVLQGHSGWLVEGNDRGTTGSARLLDGHWSNWASPCANLGDSLSFPVALNAEDLAVDCVMGGYASPMPKNAPEGATLGSAWLYLSTDGGTTFRPVSQLGTVRQQATLEAYPAAHTLFEVKGNEASTEQLAASTNGGTSWSPVYKPATKSAGFAYVGFTTAEQGVAVVANQDQTTYMVMTYNGGHKWSRVSF